MRSQSKQVADNRGVPLSVMPKVKQPPLHNTVELIGDIKSAIGEGLDASTFSLISWS